MLHTLVKRCVYMRMTHMPGKMTRTREPTRVPVYHLLRSLRRNETLKTVAPPLGMSDGFVVTLREVAEVLKKAGSGLTLVVQGQENTVKVESQFSQIPLL